MIPSRTLRRVAACVAVTRRATSGATCLGEARERPTRQLHRLLDRVRGRARVHNVPTCVTGEIRGLVDVPLAPEGFEGAVAAQDCESTLEHPTNDIKAFNNGFETRTKLPVSAPVTVEGT
jgi:hypothetical protein